MTEPAEGEHGAAGGQLAVDWVSELERCLADANSRAHYAMALAMAAGSPLSRGARIYALADVLGVTPEALLSGIKAQYGTEQLEPVVERMSAMAEAACRS